MNKVNKHKNYVLLILLLLVIVIFVIFTRDYWTVAEKEEKIYQVSYLGRGTFEEYSQSPIKQGLEQAANDFNIEITTTFLDDYNGEENGREQYQIDLLEKEVKNGADAILVEPINSEIVYKEIKKIQKKMPVVFVNSGIGGHEDIPRICCDNYVAGEQLGKEIIKYHMASERVALVKEGFEYIDIVEKYTGVLETLERENINAEVFEFKISADMNEAVMLDILKNHQIDTLIILESQSLELAGKMKKDGVMPSNLQIYGIGRTNQIISNVEDGYIQAIGVGNEYSIGYLSAKTAIEDIKGLATQEAEIEFAIVNNNNMFKKENQRLLFPFVQ
jgi:ribose transport system substrate-binding protein